MPTTLLDMRERVAQNLNRGDETDTLVDQWITDAVRRILNLLVTPMEDATADYRVEEGFSGRINIPGNLLDLYSIQVDGETLTKRSITEVKSAQKRKNTQATFYAVEAGQYLIAPIPAAGSRVLFYFRADNYNVKEDTDTIRMFDVMPDLVTFAALESAAAWAEDDIAMIKWNGAFKARYQELQFQANRDKLRHASIAPAYNCNGDW